jgi:stress response protein YsnF
VEERLTIEKCTRETGRVQIQTIVDTEYVLAQEVLRQEQVQIDRVEINRDIEMMPQVRRDGDVLIIPVVEEYLVVQKRLRLKEELHVRTVEAVEPIAKTVPVRRMRAVVERLGPGDENSNPGDAPNDPNHHRPL